MTTALPAGWTTRPPTLDDVSEILGVIHASDIAAVGEPDYTSEEVVEVLTGPNHYPGRDSWVALDAQRRIVGWAYIENTTKAERDLFDVYVHPEWGQPAQGHLLSLVLDRIPERAAEFGFAQMTARAGVIASETHYVGLLRVAGFEFVKRYARMKRHLTGAEQSPDLPAGITIRNVNHEDDADMRTFHRILETAFSELPDFMPFDYDTYRARLAALPSIVWDEWFIAEVHGVLAGILQSSGQSDEQNEGWVKNLAVAKEFRGRGLGSLLLLTAFATYARKGRVAAGLGVDLTNPTGAYRLYQSVGMRPAYEADVYERTVAAPT